MYIQLREDRYLPPDQVLALYRANGWSSAEKPELLLSGLRHAHGLVTAWDGVQLVGLGTALSDGYLVVYYAHLLVHPAYQRQGIGKRIMATFAGKYGHFHQQILVADGKAVDFYRQCGFVRAGESQPMWIYQGNEH